MQLLKHLGLAKSTRKIKPIKTRIPPKGHNLQQSNLLPPPSLLTSTSRRLSEDFKAKLEVFQSSQKNQSKGSKNETSKMRKSTPTSTNLETQESTNHWQENHPQQSQQKLKLNSSARNLQETLKTPHPPQKSNQSTKTISRRKNLQVNPLKGPTTTTPATNNSASVSKVPATACTVQNFKILAGKPPTNHQSDRQENWASETIIRSDWRAASISTKDPDSLSE